MKRLVSAVAAIAAPACCFAASAQAADSRPPGFYVDADVGANFAGVIETPTDTAKIRTNVGVAGMGAVGWDFGNGLRAEIEGSDRSNGVDWIYTLRNNGRMEPLSGAHGHVGTAAAMANLAYDLPLQRLNLPIRPYIGAGVGYAWLDLGSVSGLGLAELQLPQNNTFFGPVNVQFGSGHALAYQAIAGAALPVRGVRGLEFTMEYRYFGTADASIPTLRTSTSGDLVNGEVPSEAGRYRFTLHDNLATIGVRYRFGGL